MDNGLSSPDTLLAYAEFEDDARAFHTHGQTAMMPGNWPFEADDLEHGQSIMQQHHQQHHHYQQDQSQVIHDYKEFQQHRTRQANYGNSYVQPSAFHNTAIGLDYAQNMTHVTGQHMLNQDWHFPYPSANQSFNQETALDGILGGSYQPQSHSTSTEYSPVAPADLQHGMAMSCEMSTHPYMAISSPMNSMNTLAYPLDDYQNDMMFHMAMQNVNRHSGEFSPLDAPDSSPTGSYLEVRSLSSSDNGWTTVEFPASRHGVEYPATTNAVFNPGQTLHIRSTSDSSLDGSSSVHLSSSYEEIGCPLYSPESESFLSGDCVKHEMPYTQRCSKFEPGSNDDHSHNHTPISSSRDPSRARLSKSSISRRAQTTSVSSSSCSPISPPSRRRKGSKKASTKNTKAVIKKTTTAGRKDSNGEDRKGCRKGPLRPDQRQQAHEIRKLRACLRCKFLKKTCDKGDPCEGCRPSHARLWQVPCTRIDIRDIGFFMKDWNADYDRHISIGFSDGNIKGFSQTERLIYVTHGYGHYLPIHAREVIVRDNSCFQTDWSEKTVDPQSFEVTTAKLSAGLEGISSSQLSEYVDRHLEKGFTFFVDSHFEGTPFLTEMLKTAHRYWNSSKSPVIRKALKLVIAYNLTTQVTLAEGLPTGEDLKGMVIDDDSKYAGKTMAPVMINFQLKAALAEMWRELQKDILDELSTLYSSVYNNSGDKLRNWPTIFMLAAILLAVWEEMQFDAHYRTPDEAAVDRFCTDMETTPVGVIVGLFQAISQRVPLFTEWDTLKHHQLLGSDPSICDALTEVKNHVTKHEKYLRSRPTAAKFDRNNFDCLANKFLSRLVIRAA